MRKTLLTILGLGLFASLVHAQEEHVHELATLSSTVQVTWVIDGGSFRVRTQGGSIETVVLLGVEAPAPVTGKATTLQRMGMRLIDGLSEAAGEARLQRVGAGGISFLTTQALHQELRLEIPKTQPRDAQGRLRAFAFRAQDDYCLNTALVAMGLAYIDPGVVTPYGEQLNHALIKAYDFGRNLWAQAGDEGIVFNP